MTNDTPPKQSGDDLIVQARELLAKTTQGEWIQHKQYGWIYVGKDAESKEIVNCPTYCDADMEPSKDNAAFIVFARNHMAQICDEVVELRASSSALAKWSCSTCGCRFAQLPAPEILMDGVTRCSKCVEVEVLSNQILSLTQRAETAEANLDGIAETFRELFGYPKDEPIDLVTFLTEHVMELRKGAEKARQDAIAEAVVIAKDFEDMDAWQFVEKYHCDDVSEAIELTSKEKVHNESNRI